LAAPARAQLQLVAEPQTQGLSWCRRLACRRGLRAARDGKVEAPGRATQALLCLASELPGSRPVEDGSWAYSIPIAVPKGKYAGLLYLRAVVEEAKKSGLVARAIHLTNRGQGVSVGAPWP